MAGHPRRDRRSPLTAAASTVSAKPIAREDFFNLYFATAADPFFVQIGANDGLTYDPLHRYITKHNLAGIALEPVPSVFAALTRTYAAYPRVKCINAAIGTQRGKATLYAVKDEHLTSDDARRAFTGGASFIKDIRARTLAGKLPGNVDPQGYIAPLTVDVLTFDDLAVERVDFLQIDAEGHDYEILKTVDFRRYRPAVINFESHFLSRSVAAECRAMLRARGYEFFDSGSDTTAYRNARDLGG